MLILFLFIAAFVEASDLQRRVDRLVEKGEGTFLRNEIDKSIQIFSHALIYNLDNKQALNFLSRLENKNQVSHQARVKLSRSLELIDYIKFLKNRIDQSIIVNTKLKNRMFGRTHQYKMVGESKQVKRIRDKELRDKVLLNNKDFLDENNIQISQSLGNLMEMLTELKNEYVVHLTYLLNSNDQLKDFKAAEGRISKKSAASGRRVDVADDVKPTALMWPQDNVRILKNELALVQLEIKMLKNVVNASEQKTRRLTNELTGKTLIIYEKDEAITRHRKKFAELEKDLIETAERLNLVQRIIKEKDEVINALENFVQEVQREMNHIDDVSKEQLNTLGINLSLLESKLNAQQELSEQKLLFVEKLLAQQEIKIADYNVLIKENRVNIADLNKQLFVKTEKLHGLKSVLKSKDDKLIELNGIIKIYKGKLVDSKTTTNKKRYNVQNLEGQIDQLQSQLYDSENITADLYQRIMILESRFSRVRGKRRLGGEIK